MANTPDQESMDRCLRELNATRKELDSIELQWKQARAMSRALSVSLVLDHGLAVSKVARLSGHHRNTLGMWVEIAQAKAGQ